MDSDQSKKLILYKNEMKLIPLFKVSNIEKAVAFYTEILDFSLKFPDEEFNPFCVCLVNGDAELRLTVVDGIFGVAACVEVKKIDDLFEKYIKRGLITPKKEDSPVHEGPIDQTWGTREFYVTDSDGNTLRFEQR